MSASVSAVVFFGTPHRGSNYTSSGLMLLRLYSLIGSPSNKKLLSELQDSSYLQHLNREFYLMLDSSDIDVYSIYETKATATSGILVTKDSVFLGHSREQLFGMASNHIQLVKFEFKQDQGYSIICSAVDRVIERHSQQRPLLPASPLKPSQPASTSDTNATISEGLSRGEILPVRVGREAPRASFARPGADPDSIRREPNARFVFDALVDSDSAETGTTFSENWFKDLRDKVHQTTQERRKDTDQRIKVAIIDSGVDRAHPKLKKFFDKGQITTRSFIEGEPATSDVCGHGTHMVDLVLRVAPSAQIFMAKALLSGQSTEMDRNQHLIAEAIRYATHTEHADIISMSWGYQKEISVITNAIRDAFHHGKILLASASNTGSLSKESVAFPANLRQVICINSTDGYGNPSEFNPSPSPDRTLAVIGEGLSVACPPKIGGELRVIRGTSAATAIAAGIATLILQYSRERANAGKAVEAPHRLSHCDAMRKVFYGMAKDRQGYHILVPALIFHQDGPHRHYRISQCISGILDAL
ncbi:peptidase S8/S53 domain-containing protein [Ilyonectria destructans]|nr:peptidase S8/S53 domain-containing protein [Ilyonectria destructans]